MWSSADGSSIHVYSDPPGIRGVAIAADARVLDDGGTPTIPHLDFTSRVRTPREGQVVVFENDTGHFLVAQVVDVQATSHGDAEDRLVLSYFVPTFVREETTDDVDVDLDFHVAQSADVTRLAAEVEAELRRLRPTIPELAPAHGGMGHNNPPEFMPLSLEEHDEVIEAARRIGQEAFSREPDRSAVMQAVSKLGAAAKAMAVWVGYKCDLAAEEFAKQIGKSLADTRVLLGGWLILSGKIEDLLAAVSTWLT